MGRAVGAVACVTIMGSGLPRADSRFGVTLLELGASLPVAPAGHDGGMQAAIRAVGGAVERR